VLPSHHAAAAAPAAVPLRARGWSPLAIARFAAGAVLIDADHSAAYAWRIRDLSLPRAYRYHRRRHGRPFRRHRPAVAVDPRRPLYAPLLLAGLTLLARRYPLLRPPVAGLLLHRLLAGVAGGLRDRGGPGASGTGRDRGPPGAPRSRWRRRGTATARRTARRPSRAARCRRTPPRATHPAAPAEVEGPDRVPEPARARGRTGTSIASVASLCNKCYHTHT
jgi:hypothetical protein